MSPSRVKGLSWIAVVLFTIGFAVSVMAKDDKHSEPSPSASPSATQEAAADSDAEEEGPSLVDPQSLADLKQQQMEVQKLQKELAAREAELKARERALDDQIKKLEEIRTELAKTDSARQKENEEKVAKLIEMVETMSPKSGMQLLTSLDDALAVAVMGRMTTAKLAKIMNSMDPKRSAKLSELMAGVVRAKEAASPEAVPAGTPRERRPSAPSTGGDATTPSKEEKGVKKQNEHTNNEYKNDQQRFSSESDSTEEHALERRSLELG